MRAKAIAVLLAATAIVGVLAVPAGASAAKPRHLKQKPLVSAELHVRGTHGFGLDLFTVGSHGVILSATRRSSRLENPGVNYFSPEGGAFNAGKLDVTIGRLGHFRGRFVPTSTEERKPEQECEGMPTTVEKGFFVGSFDFRGERGYTAVHSRRVRGTVTHQAAEVCTYATNPPWHESAREAKRRREGERGEFHLVAGDERARILFQARREEPPKGLPGPSMNFSASVNGGKAGDFSVDYSVFIFFFEGDAATVFQTPNLAEPLAEATIAPPAPFSGSATFHLEDPKTATWTGDLSVDLPGIGRVPLAGEGIGAGLCNGPSNCTKTLPRDLQPVLETSSDEIVAIKVPKKAGS